jgi:hypothetical protein
MVKKRNSSGTPKTLKSNSNNKSLQRKTHTPKRPNPFTRKIPNRLKPKPKTKSATPNLRAHLKIALIRSLRMKTHMALLT